MLFIFAAKPPSPAFIDGFVNALHKLKCCGTNHCIFNGEVIDLVDFLAVGMRKFAAGLGPDFVNGTGVVGIQEPAWQILEHLILIFIGSEISGLKVSRLHAQVFGNPFDVLLRKKRAGSFAAVGALKAVDLCKHLIMDFLYHIVQVFWWFPF